MMTAAIEGGGVAALELRSVTCWLGSDPAIDGVDLEVAEGELVTLIGRSGAGKTTLLRAIAGLERVEGGVIIDGVDMTAVPPEQRDVSMVFQSNALFPTHTARGNVALPLKIRKMAAGEVMDRVRAEGRALGIEEVLDRWPEELSEGHQRLVQIARAMVRVPRLFLFDEPLEGLDPPTRKRLRDELRMLQAGYGVAMILATNDPAEALTMGDRVAVLERGRIVQLDRPRVLWRRPSTRSVAAITGPIGYIEVTVRKDGHRFRLGGPGVSLIAGSPGLSVLSGERALLGVRPDAVRLDPAGPIAATLGPLRRHGETIGRELTIGSTRVTSTVGVELDEGTRVRVALEHWSLFDDAGRLVAAGG
jgi:multiple sugar transport system ATP-binding protein